MNLFEGCDVEIISGRRQGKSGKITEIQLDGTLIISVKGLPYEVPQQPSEVRPLKTSDTAYKGKTLADVKGDEKQRLMQYLVKTKQLCPSFPHFRRTNAISLAGA